MPRDESEPGVPLTTERPKNEVPPGWDEEEPRPRDTPQAALDWGTTAREEVLGESVRRRDARTEPDFDERPPQDPDVVVGAAVSEPGSEYDQGLTDDEPDAVGELDGDPEYSLPAEEAAVRIRRP